jgi:hypothetical protein
MHWFERLLRNLLPYKEIGWESIGEQFTRFQVLRTRWLNVYLHKLDAPAWHPQCHDHPWTFLAVVLMGGYLEATPDRKRKWRPPGSVLWRPATFSHNVVTRGVSWSIIVTGPRTRKWGFLNCGVFL